MVEVARLPGNFERSGGSRVLANKLFSMKPLSLMSHWLLAAVFLPLLPLMACAEPPTADPASEPSVIATAKALPAVVNVNTRRVIRHVNDRVVQQSQTVSINSR